MQVVSHTHPIVRPCLPAACSWVTKVDQFVQLSDLPQERSQASHLKCLGHVAAAIAQTGGDRGLTDRVRQVWTEGGRLGEGRQGKLSAVLGLGGVAGSLFESRLPVWAGRHMCLPPCLGSVPCQPPPPDHPHPARTALPSPHLQLEGLLQQVDLLELSSRAAQQEKEQLQVRGGAGGAVGQGGAAEGAAAPA